MIESRALWANMPLCGLLATFGAGLPCVAPAQEAQLPEVVVSAERSSSIASRTPVAISVLTAQQLADAGIDSAAAIANRLPNVQLDGANDGLRITIRGVSSADTSEKGDPSAAFMLDGAYIARPQLQNVSLFDLARVEVLRGPQGTLYGRNTTAGVVNVLSNQPGMVVEGAASWTLGDYRSRRGEAMLNLPLSQVLAVRAALAVHRHDSYLINRQGTGYRLGLDRDDSAVRLSAKLALGAGANVLLRYDRSRIDSNNDSIVPVTNFYRLGAGAPAWCAGSTNERLTNAFVPPNAALQQGDGKVSTSGIGLSFSMPLGPAMLEYHGSHRSADDAHHLNFYYQLAPAVAIGVREAFSGAYRQDSHELRLATSGDGPLKAQGGAYYFREASDLLATFRDLELVGLPPYYVFPQGPTVAVGKALFGQATYSLAPQLRATAGVRFSRDDKSRIGSTNFQQAAAFNPATDLRLLNAAFLKTDKTIWRLGAEYDPAPATLLYASVSTGYKAGGFNDGCLAGASYNGIACPAQLALPASALFYQPEALTAYEGGVKTTFLDKRASLNASLFYYDYTNLQLSGIVILHGAPRFTTTNAGVARVKGLEVEGQWLLTRADRVAYTLSWLDARYASYAPDGASSWAGKRLDRAPASSASIDYQHSVRLRAGQLRAGLFARASAASVISVPSQLAQYHVPGRTQLDLSLSYLPPASAWRLQALVKNASNKVVPIAIDSVGMVVPSDPRTVAVRIESIF